MKVPKARKLASGNWFIQLRLNGESVPVTASSEKECIRMAALVKAEHRAGKRIINDKSSYTLEQAIDYYIESRENSLSPATVRGYYTIKNNRLQSAMKTPLRDIDNWQALFDIDAKRLSPKTIKNTHRLIKSVVKAAGFDLPTITLPQLTREERPWLDHAQILQFLEAAKDQPGELAALLALHSLRRSEIMGLKKENINLSQGTIRVSGALVYGKDNKRVDKKTNKNEKSTRTVPIMIPRLKTLLEGAEYTDGKLFTCNPNTLWSQINRICRAAELPEVGVHGLRHSFASLGYHLKMSELEIMDLGGWSDYNTVHKIYTHLAHTERLRNINKMSAFFSQSETGDK